MRSTGSLLSQRECQAEDCHHTDRARRTGRVCAGHGLLHESRLRRRYHRDDDRPGASRQRSSPTRSTSASAASMRSRPSIRRTCRSSSSPQPRITCLKQARGRRRWSCRKPSRRCKRRKISRGRRSPSPRSTASPTPSPRPGSIKTAAIRRWLSLWRFRSRRCPRRCTPVASTRSGYRNQRFWSRPRKTGESRSHGFDTVAKTFHLDGLAHDRTVGERSPRCRWSAALPAVMHQTAAWANANNAGSAQVLRQVLTKADHTDHRHSSPQSFRRRAQPGRRYNP